MNKEFELKKIDETTKIIQYEVLRKGLYYGLLSVEKQADIDLQDCMSMILK